MMRKLSDDLEKLYQLREVRERVQALLDEGAATLSQIGSITEKGDVSSRKPEEPHAFDQWLGLGNRIEAALVLKAQTRKEPADKTCKFLGKIKGLTLADLFPRGEDPPTNNEQQSNAALDRRLPVLLAALSLQLLTRRSDSALSEQAIFCYFRVIEELTVAARPDWTMGAARAGEGGNISIYVTGECIRAILMFEDAFRKTVAFFDRTRELIDEYNILGQMMSSAGREDKHPVREWTQKAVERLWLDWYVSTAPNRLERAFNIEDDPVPPTEEKANGKKNPDEDAPGTKRATFEWLGQYLKDLPHKLKAATGEARKSIESAREEIGKFPPPDPPPTDLPLGTKLRPRNRLEAQQFAGSVVDVAYQQAIHAEQLCNRTDLDLSKLLEELSIQFKEVQKNIRRLLDPSRRYVEGVLERELASASGELDAGELAFAASSFGALTGWVSSRSHLMRACKVLIENMPANGLPSTKRPFHSTRRGYKLFPTGCDMFRSLAQVLERTGYEFEPESIRMFVDTIQEKVIRDGDKIGWNFEGATDSERPSVWVTAVVVATLERLLMTLNARINVSVLHHFALPASAPDVGQEEQPRGLTLGELIYPDYGFSAYYDGREGSGKTPSIAIRLQQMRAHLTNVSLPQLTETGEREDVFAAVLYGPPQTGKTTLAEALATSSRVPLVRLSPFDLTLESHQSIEGRTRHVFEALSMLTKVVILFDEFESVLERRIGDDDDEERSQEHDGKAAAPPPASPATQFLLTGLLPHLVKLHAVARHQEIVYFLATNRLKKIDDAAIRRGRFDLWLPVYNPDPLSRAGTFLQRLQRVIQLDLAPKKEWVLDEKAAMRLLEVIVFHADVPASTLAEVVFRLPKWILRKEPRPDDARAGRFFRHVFDGAESLFDQRRRTPSLSQEDEDCLRRPLTPATSLWRGEIRERAWLKSVENDLVRSFNHESQAGTTQTVAQILYRCLRPANTLEVTADARLAPMALS